MEDKNIIFRRDYQYISTTKELVLFSLTLFLYIFAAGLFFQATKVILDVAKVLLILGFTSIILGLIIYPLYLFKNIRLKFSNRTKVNIDFFDEYIEYNKLKNSIEEFIDYKLIDYYIEKKDYYLLFIIKGSTIYIPKQGLDKLDDFLSDKIEKRMRKKPFWKHI